MTLQPQPVDRTLWFEAALTPDGWARDVRLTIAGGRIAGLETGAARGAGDEGGGVALPGVANVHSHAFQRAMAGLTEARGPSDDDFWTWRALMYRFLDRGAPFVLVTSPESRSYVRMIIERLFATLPVLSHVELAKGIEIKILGSIS